MTASCAERRAPRTALLRLLLLVAAVLWGTLAAAQDGGWYDAREASERLEQSDLATARAMLQAMRAQYGPDDAATLFVEGKLAHFEGRYRDAVQALNASIAAGGNFDSVRQLRDLAESTDALVGPMATYTTRDGLFEIRYDARRDAVLLPWAEETLEQAWYELGYDLGHWPEPPIRVEILPTSLDLARVSSLSEEAIRTSGTIALCKYNKLMLTSPRATARGYGWRDTLAHEYVHYVVSHLVHQDLPIWLHEALAKYLEQRWRGHRWMTMEPSREDLLGSRVADNRLITFEQMHPSMAYLPSAEDASTAYAQVFTVMEYLVARRGIGSIRGWLERVRDGATLEDAFEATFGVSFPTFERIWTGWLRERPRVEIPGQFREEVSLIAGPAEGEASEDDPDGLGSVQARDLLRLGELLRARGHVEASIVEYRKAESLLGTAHPVLQNALARALLDVQRPAEAVAAVDDVRRWHPTFYRSHLHRALGLLAQGDASAALPALDEAAGINPFDPEVHQAFVQAWEMLQQVEAAEVARQRLRMVQ
jgi:tetratricopeptide (TPR) repeat protein